MKLKLAIIFIVTFAAVLPMLAAAQGAPCTSNSAPGITLCNGLGTSVTAQQIATKIFTYIGGIIGILAIIMIVYSGIRMVLSRGEPEQLKAAKTSMSWAIGGLLVSALSFVFLLSFENFIGTSPGNVTGTPGQVANPLNAGTLAAFLGQVAVGAVALIGGLAVVLLVYNAFIYITSGGNEEQLKKSKSGMLWSVVGFMTAILAYVIINAIKNLF